jgi:nitrous oxide reductase accessory protein NosL
MKRRTLRVVVAGVLLACCAVLPAAAGDEPPPPGPDDRCAVCGMFVHKYPNWVATVVFADGAQVFFDGPKDLFRYLLDLEKYQAGDREIAGVFVTDYYRVRFIDAETAHFVTGSDVTGPMGAELIPLGKREEAETFARDHGGQETLEFGDITLEKVPR